MNNNDETVTKSHYNQIIDIMDSQDNNDTSNEVLDNALLLQESTTVAEFENNGIVGVLTVGNESVQFSSTSGPAVSPPTTTTTAASSSRTSVVLQNSMKIAFSYRQETNDRVKVISELVHNQIATPDSPQPVFYAPNFQAALALIDGGKVLRRIYEGASLVVVFLSPTYHNSRFCYQEWRAIKNRFMIGGDDHEYERLLLIKLGDFDATKLGLYDDDFYIDATKLNDEEVAGIIMERWHLVKKIFQT
ncbi:unnamed protein product [Rotaria sordida]|uniref:TIR domain-containing protein n=1 Tax=Rotaria sordida TaxID=392033 RepID=A0A814Q4K1_9BILA|nr:unnamed protein product [Rotaria sordida]